MTNSGKRRVYRLLPVFERTRGLLFNVTESQRILARLRGRQKLAGVHGEWSAGPEVPLGDYPCALGYAPVVSRRVVDALGKELRQGGELVPVGAEALAPDRYYLYVVDALVDCLDETRSARPNRSTGEMAQVSFLPSMLNDTSPAFRVPQSPLFVFWCDWFVDALTSLIPEQVDARVIWAEDPSIARFPRPMR